MTIKKKFEFFTIDGIDYLRINKENIVLKVLCFKNIQEYNLYVSKRIIYQVKNLPIGLEVVENKNFVRESLINRLSDWYFYTIFKKNL